jgi:hypothetical protein
MSLNWEKHRQDRCPHTATMTDAAADAYVCLECGLVMTDKPSLCPDVCPERVYPENTIPDATRRCLVDMATKMSLSRDHVARASRLVSDLGATTRHPAALAACLMTTTSSWSIQDTAAALDLPVKALYRAVSRHKRKIKYL